MSLDDFDKLACSTLDEKDIAFVEEALARLQYAQDQARLEESLKHLDSTVAATKRAHLGVMATQRRANRAGLGARYHAIATDRQEVFKNTPYYLMTLPYVCSSIDVGRRAEALGGRPASGAGGKE
jgi:hypothetical protein